MTAPGVKVENSGEELRLTAEGDWTLSGELVAMDAALRDVAASAAGRTLVIDVAGISRIDTAGAMMLQRTAHDCGGGQEWEPLDGFTGATGKVASLLEQSRNYLDICEVEPPDRSAFLGMLERLGTGAENVLLEAVRIINFIGMVVAGFGRLIRSPGRIRMTSVVFHMEEAGLNATLIVGMMSFLIGAVIAFMGAKILSQFGVSIFTVELIGVTVLREFGVLLTAILIAGRSGSAFTAQIGSMKLREEIDAMSAMGIDPLEALVLPRTLAMMLVMPALAFIAAMLGLLGGALTAWLAMDISPTLFLTRTQDTIVIQNFWVGMVKAPFFAFFISVIGCFQGMMVRSSAEDLGRKVTTSVVQSLFVVILMDALFAIFFLELDI